MFSAILISVGVVSHQWHLVSPSGFWVCHSLWSPAPQVFRLIISSNCHSVLLPCNAFSVLPVAQLMHCILSRFSLRLTSLRVKASAQSLGAIGEGNLELGFTILREMALSPSCLSAAIHALRDLQNTCLDSKRGVRFIYSCS